MLQAMWEFQSLITDLTGLPIANVSVYDASTAAAEAITCAVRVHNRKATQKNVVYISELIPPTRRSVIENPTSGGGIELRVLPHLETGHLDLSAIDACEGSCAVYVEQPNPLGLLDEGLLGLKDRIGTGTALIVGVQPTSSVCSSHRAIGVLTSSWARDSPSVASRDGGRSDLRDLRLCTTLPQTDARTHRGSDH